MSEASSVQQQNNNNVISPGEYVLKKLFSEFVLASQQKLDFIYQQQLVGARSDNSTRTTANTLGVLID